MTRAGLVVTRGGGGRYSDTPGSPRVTADLDAEAPITYARTARALDFPA